MHGRPTGGVCLLPLSIPALLTASQPAQAPCLIWTGEGGHEADWLQDLWGPVQNENAGPLVQKVVSRWQHQNMTLSMGPTSNCTGHRSMKTPCCGIREEGGWEGL